MFTLKILGDLKRSTQTLSQLSMQKRRPVTAVMNERSASPHSERVCLWISLRMTSALQPSDIPLSANTEPVADTDTRCFHCTKNLKQKRKIEARCCVCGPTCDLRTYRCCWCRRWWPRSSESWSEGLMWSPWRRPSSCCCEQPFDSILQKIANNITMLSININRLLH